MGRGISVEAGLWLGMVALGVLAFADAPLRTFGQRFTRARHHERLVLFSIELNLVLLWAMAKFFFGWERSLTRPKMEHVAMLAGLIITAAGVLVAITARWRLGRAFSATFAIRPDHELATGWPYSMVRHPMYTGILLALAGSALVWNSALTLALAALLSIPFAFHTAIEEPMLEQHFGERYREYRGRVPRMIPFAPASWRSGARR
jgi:protein-S-isoprenylcysteine O-methyltransferase Ste14